MSRLILPFFQGLKPLSRQRRIRHSLRAFRLAWARGAAHAAWPLLADRPPGSRVLVLAPHPDDEVLGCGGTLLKHLAAGDGVTCVYLTAAPPWPLRRTEAQAAARLLGLTDLVFLDGPDGALAPGADLVAALRAVLLDRQPDLIYVPFFLDPHPDHQAAGALLAAAAAGARLPGCRCCAYEVWSPLVANLLVDVGAQMPAKREAIRCYGSQLQNVDYGRLAEGLSIYRAAAYAGRVAHAEAFYLAGLDDYVALAAEAGSCTS